MISSGVVVFFCEVIISSSVGTLDWQVVSSEFSSLQFTPANKVPKCRLSFICCSCSTEPLVYELRNVLFCCPPIRLLSVFCPVVQLITSVHSVTLWDKRIRLYDCSSTDQFVWIMVSRFGNAKFYMPVARSLALFSFMIFLTALCWSWKVLLLITSTRFAILLYASFFDI